MTDSEPQEELEPSSSLLTRIAGILERSLRVSTVIGIRGVLSAILLFGYLSIGGFLVAIGSPAAPTNFLSLQSDPRFYLSITAVALFIVQATGSLILYQFLTGVELNVPNS